MQQFKNVHLCASQLPQWNSKNPTCVLGSRNKITATLEYNNDKNFNYLIACKFQTFYQLLDFIVAITIVIIIKEEISAIIIDV